LSCESGDLSSTRSRDRSIAPSDAAPVAVDRRDGRRRDGGRAERRPRLLASAATVDEAAAAIAGGARIVDIKDPAAGTLGAPEFATLSAVAALRDRIDPSRPLSAAIGPARDPAAIGRAAAAARLGFEFVKAGLDGVTGPDEAATLLAAIATALHADGGRARLIAATFADPCDPVPLDMVALPEVARRSGCAGILLDTALKDGRTLFDHRNDADLAHFVAAARDCGLLVALAGSLGPAEVARAVSLAPDIIGLRGALCEGGRAGRLDPARVRRFVVLLESGGPAIAR